MTGTSPTAPRILILDTDRRMLATLRDFAVKGWRDASVQAMSADLEDMLDAAVRLTGFDVLLAGCDFSTTGPAEHPVLRALAAITADPRSPAVILLTRGGSEYTAVQATRAGAFDCIPRQLAGREQIVSALQRAVLTRAGVGNDEPRYFGYDVRRRLAQHDNVSIHVAWSAERAKEVVLKVLHRGRGSMCRDQTFQRFVDELKLLYEIDDRAVAEIYDFRATRAYCYIAMEYFPAGHLGARLAQPLDPHAALRRATHIADALAIVHAAGIVHRDLKPGNIMLREDGTIALIDFGISQSSLLAGSAEAEQGELISGTPYYMSPEQANGAATDERADLYALGVILYQMLTGRKPFVGATAQQILDQHRAAPVPRLPKPLDLCQPVLDRLLAKSPDARPARARELAETLQALRNELAGADCGYGFSAGAA